MHWEILSCPYGHPANTSIASGFRDWAELQSSKSSYIVLFVKRAAFLLLFVPSQSSLIWESVKWTKLVAGFYFSLPLFFHSIRFNLKMVWFVSLIYKRAGASNHRQCTYCDNVKYCDLSLAFAWYFSELIAWTCDFTGPSLHLYSLHHFL